MHKMNMYDAFMAAADLIEANHRAFYFLEWHVPKSCGSHGCALGWVGFFAGMKGTAAVVAEALGYSDPLNGNGAIPRNDLLFYRDMEKIHGSNGWQVDPAACVVTMRAYAEKHLKKKPEALDPVLANMLKGMDKILTEEESLT